MAIHPYSFTLQIAEIPFKIEMTDEHWNEFLQKKFKPYLTHKKPFFSIRLERRNISTNFRYDKSPSLDRIYIPRSCRYFKLFNTNLKIIFSSRLLEHQGFVFHASSLQKNGVGYIFIGPSGAGKSTILKLFTNHKPFGDDSAIIRKTEEQYFLYASPFYEKNPLPKLNIRVPIKGIYFLHQSPEDKVVETHQPQLKLFQHIWMYKLENLPKIDRISWQKKLWLESYDIAQHVPVFDLFFTKNTHFMKLVEK